MDIKIQLARLKRRLFSVPFIRNKKYQSYWFDYVLGSSSAQIIQIGSNDGKTGDPLYELLQKNAEWKGLFVEPIPEIFEKLRSNYSDKTRFRFENVAVNEGQMLPFYIVDREAALSNISELPYWFDQLGSFNRDHIVDQLEGILEPYIIEISVEGVRLSTLLSRNEIDSIDILHIDAEGYDWKILSQLDLLKYNPRFILYEYNHLSHSDLRASSHFLMDGYELFDVGIDILAVSKSVDKNILKNMKNHMPIFIIPK